MNKFQLYLLEETLSLMRKTSILFLLIVLSAGFMNIIGQQTAYYTDPDEDLREALELFRKEKYSAAQERFITYLDRTADTETTSQIDASYYIAVCALRLEHQNASDLIEHFIEDYPENPRANQARFEMGNYLFNEQKYSRALRWYEQMKTRKLSKDEKYLYTFNTAYCYFDMKDYDRAAGLFYQLLNQPGDRSEDAQYYYGYIQYLDGNYETALGHFLDLQDSRNYGGIVPFYIAQVFYLQEKYDKVIEFAPGLLNRADPGQRNEISRIVGDAFFREGRYSEAIPYLEQYRDGVRKMSREEYYQLGFAYYRNGQLENAVGELEQVKDGDDALSQTSNHLLGGILIDLGEKMKARSAFRKAANLNHDTGIQEESLLNYAKLSFDLSISNETLRAFEEFLEKFPDSQHIDEAYDYLVKVFMNTRNYKEALSTMDRIPDKNADIRAAYQRIAYYRGLELFNNLRYSDAIEHFDKSLNYSTFNAKLKALAYYWRGEAWYSMDGYDQAIKSYNLFINSSGAYNLPEFNLAYYNLGYTYFKKRNYDEAMNWFRKYINRADTRNMKLLADAYNRVGDCYFINSRYWQGIEYYGQASALKTEDADYAAFQKGFSLGLVQRPNKKIEALNDLIHDFPKSRYADDALYKIARSYVDLDNQEEAIRNFKNLIQSYPSSSYVRKSYLQLALISYNNKQNTQAMDYYKKVVNSWPDSPEARDAIAGIKNIYMEEDRVDEYFTYVKSSGQGGDISVDEQDSLSYMAAESIFMRGDCDRAKDNFTQYINRFPDGYFLLNAHYYRADCYFRAAQYDLALDDYEWILSRGGNDFSELALSRTGAIYYQQRNYRKSLEIYRQLVEKAEVRTNIVDARLGIMRCLYNLEDYQEVVKAANDLLSTDKISAEIVREATYKLAKAYQNTGDMEGALDAFGVLAEDVKNIEGAEAKYWKAQILYDMGDVDKAEKEVLDFLEKNTTHQYWLARAYILWSDIYLKKQDIFQAKATLQILLENYANEDDGILETVRGRISVIEEMEDK
jgi:tetratricopeptide (TPR) repeat protein